MAPRWSRDLLKGRPKMLLREAICAACDSFDAILRRSDPLTPPCRLRVRVGCFLSFIRAQRFRDVGLEFASHLQSLANLGPGSFLLDLGCGCGQIASAVSDLLLDGHYQGIDPDREAVDWCSAHIGKLRRQF